MSRWNNDDITKYSEPDEDFYNKQIENLNKSMESFCQIAKIDNSRVLVNAKTLKEVIRRVDMRDLYFHVFHNNMEANEYKIITGLTVFWILKLKPFWYYIKPEDEANDELITLASMINEKFSLHLVITLLKEYNVDFISKGENLVAAYYDELEYSFRYRDLSKESLFLMFDPFYYLYFYNSSINEKGELRI